MGGTQSNLFDFRQDKIEERRRKDEEDARIMDYLSKLPAQQIRDDLCRSQGHPKPAFGEGETWRFYYLRECERRGKRLLEELGWPTNEKAEYRNIHTGSEDTLWDIAVGYQFGRGDPSTAIDEEVHVVIEHWEPAGNNVGVV